MTFPVLADYKVALSNSGARFATLNITPRRDARNNPQFLAGNFAGVFPVSDSAGRSLAIKCFTRDIPDLERRYRAVSRFVAKARSPYFVAFDFLPKEVFISSRIAATGEYPVVCMPWVTGRTLDGVIKGLCAKANREALAGLARAWARMCLDLLERGVAHGDLKHDNVLITPEGRLTLVDYDSMYVPELRGLPCTLLGSVNFQHPLRHVSHFDATTDHFSMLAVLLSLRMLVLAPELFEHHHNGENILFTRQDYLDPAASPLFGAMVRSDDLFVRDWAARLAQACRARSPSIPALKEALRAAIKLGVTAETSRTTSLLHRLAGGVAAR